MLTIPPSASLQWSEGSPVHDLDLDQADHIGPEEVIFSRREGNTSVLVGVENNIPYLEVSKGGNVQTRGGGGAHAGGELATSGRCRFRAQRSPFISMAKVLPP